MTENTFPTAHNIFQRVQGVLTQPGATWKEIAHEPGGLKEVLLPYGLVMFFIPAAMTLIRGLASPLQSIEVAASIFVISFVMTLVMGLLMTGMAPLFGARKSYVLSCRVLIYTATPACVAAILGIVPVLGWVVRIAAIPWAIFLLYQGTGIVLETKGAKQLLFLIGVIICYLVVGGIPMALAMKQFYHPSSFADVAQTPGGTPASTYPFSQRPVSAKVNAALDEMVQEAIKNGTLKPEEAGTYRKALQLQLSDEQIKAIESAPDVPKP